MPDWTSNIIFGFAVVLVVVAVVVAVSFLRR